MAIVVETTWTRIEASATTSTIITLDAGGAADGNTLLAFLTKDDDVATTGPGGWTLVQGFESNNAIYTEIWKREASGDSSSSYSGESFSAGTQESIADGFSWNNDGTKFFIVGDDATVYEYTCSVGFDLSSTVAYSNESFIVSSQDIDPRDISWNNDGTKFFTIGNSTNAVYEYTCSTGFDLSSTVAYSGESFSVNTQEPTATALYWNSDGTKFFIVGTSNDTVYEYTCSTGFDLSSTVSYNSQSFSVNSQEPGPEGLSWNNDGTKFFIVGTTNDAVFEYTCSVGFDLSSTVAYSGNSFSVSNQPIDISWNSDGTKFFTVSNSGSIVYEHDADSAYTVREAITYTWTGDNEEYVLSVSEISGADFTTITAATQNVGTDASPVSNAITINEANSIVLAGFGVDGDSTPFTPDAGLTQLSSLQSTTGAGSAGQYVGSELFASTGSTGTFDHTINSADQWTGFAVMIEPTAALPSLVYKPYRFNNFLVR